MPDICSKRNNKKRHIILTSRDLKKRHLLIVALANSVNEAKVVKEKARLAVHKMNRQLSEEISYTILVSINQD